MKRLFIALAAAVAVSTASAIITDQQEFETSFDDFLADLQGEDSSEITAYETGTQPSFNAPYPFENFGSNYLKLDTGDATLWRSNTTEAANVYFDMAIQFTPTAEGEEPDHNGNKIVIFMDANTNLVVISGTSAENHTPETNRYVTAIEAKSWARLTVSALQDQGSLLFRVSVNGEPISRNLFYSLDDDTTVREVGFSGSGALDDFVARTTDPFITKPAVSVGGEGYASFDEALSDAGSDVIFELNADATHVFSAGETLRVKPGVYEFTPNAAPDVAIRRSLQDGVFTYEAIEGVASVAHGGTTTWYATFAEAYDAAYAITTGGYPVLTIRVDSDFTPAITYSQFFQQIKIESTTESPVTVNLKNAAGTYTMTAVGYQASANVTLVLPADLVAVNNAYLTGGCTVEVPEGVTLTLAPGSSGTLSNIGGLVGAGTLVAPTDPGALYNFIANATYSGWLKAATWTGTLQCSGDMRTVNYGILFDNIANANASVRFSGFTNYVHNATSASVFETIELVGDGLTLAGEYSSAATYTFTNALKGDGALNVAVTGGGYGNPLKTIKFTGDVSGFGGSITFTDGATYKTHDVLIFGSDSSTVSNAVVVSAGVVMTNATGKTWNVPGGVVVNGSLVANGTVTTAAELDGSGVYEVNASTAAIKVANTWTGTYNANFKAANNAIFYIPVNAAATTVINGANGEFGGYPNFGGAAPTIAGEVVLNANWTIANGWAGDGNVTTFAELSGSGDLTVDGTTSGTDPIYYTINELDGYTGTLGGARGYFTIGKVNVATQPTNGARVVKIAIGVNGSMLSDNVPLYVGGVDSGKTLTYDANGAEGAGLYYVGGSIDPEHGGTEVTIPAESIADATNKVEIAAPADSGVTTPEQKAAYKDLFVLSAVDKGDGTFTVTIEGIKEEKVAEVEADAVTTLLDSEDSTVAVPAGLFYKITPSAALPISGTPQKGVSTGSVTVTKPSGTTQGFFEVKLSPTPID